MITLHKKSLSIFLAFLITLSFLPTSDSQSKVEASNKAQLANASQNYIEQKIVAADGLAGDCFGFSVALEDDTALVGAYVGGFGLYGNQGSAYVFTRTGATWMQQAKLTAADGKVEDYFGISVSLSGDTALVGAYWDDVGSNNNQGSAYVFVRNGTTWTQQAQLTASDGAAEDWFGIAVSISGDTALVGEYGDEIGSNSNQGSAYIFTRSGTTWAQQAKLTASDGTSLDYFGRSVALSGDTALVGAYYDEVGTQVGQGSAYVFTRSGTTWMQQSKLVASDGAAEDAFGSSVAITGDTALVGAPFDDIGESDHQGSAYIFTRDGISWSEQAHLVATDGETMDRFGSSVALWVEEAIVGVFRDNVSVNYEQGSAYIFMRSGSSWTEHAQLTASDGSEYDHFGRSVAITNNTVLVGADGDSIGTKVGQGSAYIFVETGSAELYLPIILGNSP